MAVIRNRFARYVVVVLLALIVDDCGGFYVLRRQESVSRLRALWSTGENELVQLAYDAVLRGDGLMLDIERENDAQVSRIRGRLVELKKGRVLQLTFKRRSACDLVKNYGLKSKRVKEVEETLLDAAAPRSADARKAIETAIHKATRTRLLVEDQAEYVLTPAGELQKSMKQSVARAQIKSHDRTKRRVLNEEIASGFMQGLGLIDSKGKPRPARQRKLSQVRQFSEILDKAVSQEVDIVLDAGSGAGYLSFAAHQVLGKQRNQTIKVIGIERRQDLVHEANKLARSLSIPPDELEFVCGDIQQLASDVLQSSKNAVVIALHACDTATDEALHAGLSAKATALLVSPCCHKELRPQFERRLAVLRKNQAHLDDSQLALLEIGRHGLLLGRQAEAITDLFRSLLCQIVGYETQITEWIGTDHTHKNALIVAKRNPQAGHSSEARNRLSALARYYGISHHQLATLLGESGLLSLDDDHGQHDAAARLLRSRPQSRNEDDDDMMTPASLSSSRYHASRLPAILPASSTES